MKEVILIKYGELTTKKDNRNFFIKTLKKNIFEKLSSFEFDIIDDYYRMFIIPLNDDINLINELCYLISKGDNGNIVLMQNFKDRGINESK